MINSRHIFSALLVAVLLTFNLSAQKIDKFPDIKLKPEAKKKRPVPKLKSKYFDRVGILSSLDIEHLESELVNFEDATGGQMVIMKIATLHGRPVDQYIDSVVKLNKIGQDNGQKYIFLIVSMYDKLIRIKVGEGWKKEIPDEKIVEVTYGIIPYFQMGKFKDGFLYAVYSFQKMIVGTAPARPLLHGYYPRSYIIMFLVFTIVMALLFFIFRQGSRHHYHGGGMTFSGGEKPNWFSSGSGYCASGQEGNSGGKEFQGKGASDSW